VFVFVPVATEESERGAALRPVGVGGMVRTGGFAMLLNPGVGVPGPAEGVAGAGTGPEELEDEDAG
jgi:hypothetical protein